MASALSNLRILEVGAALSAPFAAELLADFGAEVIKVERPGGGDLFRIGGAQISDASGNPVTNAGFLAINRNKRSITIDMRWDPLESTCRHASLSIL